MSAPLFPHAAIATPHYLASSAGLAVLTSGGNAVDAAVAANLVLAVVYPQMCGLGGDLFAMVWAEGELSGLNSSGHLPAGARLDGDKVPRTGIDSAVVPGAVAGWLALLGRYGTRSIEELAPPAIRLAREGCPRSAGLERVTKASAPLLQRDAQAARIFLAEGLLRQPDLAETVESIDDFYTGPVAKNVPPPFTPDDFAEHTAEWVEPERTSVAGLEVCEMPPNSRGHLALRAIERMEPLDGLRPDNAEFHLRMIRALDSPRRQPCRRARPARNRCRGPASGVPGAGGTCARDPGRGWTSGGGVRSAVGWSGGWVLKVMRHSNADDADSSRMRADGWWLGYESSEVSDKRCAAVQPALRFLATPPTLRMLRAVCRPRPASSE